MAFNMDFNAEDMKEKEFNFFEIGIHLVKITTIKFDQWNEGGEPKPFVEIGVVSSDNPDVEDSARLWFNTDGARNYSLNIIRGIFVHNASEDKKDEVREKFNALKNAAELEKAMQKMLPGKEAWFTVYPSETRTYTAKDGSTKPSLDKNIYGYKPAERKTADAAPATATVIEGAQPASADDVPFGF